MTNKEMKNEALANLSSGLRDILESELQAGNRIKETYKGRFSAQTEDWYFVFLSKPFKSPIREDLKGIKYVYVNDRYYWNAEYDDLINHQTLACSF